MFKTIDRKIKEACPSWENNIITGWGSDRVHISINVHSFLWAKHWNKNLSTGAWRTGLTYPLLHLDPGFILGSSRSNIVNQF
jgi:hypothetical protein